MSFGFSVGDFIGVGQLAWRVYRACKDIPAEYQEIRREVCTLHIVLRELEDDAGDPSSIINRYGVSRTTELLTIRDNIQQTLRELERIVEQYRSLSAEKRIWDHVKLASEDINSIRGKLTFYTSSISLFKQSLCVGSLARIEEKLDEVVREIRASSTKDAESRSLKVPRSFLPEEPGAVPWPRMPEDFYQKKPNATPRPKEPVPFGWEHNELPSRRPRAARLSAQAVTQSVEEMVESKVPVWDSKTKPRRRSSGLRIESGSGDRTEGSIEELGWGVYQGTTRTEYRIKVSTMTRQKGSTSTSWPDLRTSSRSALPNSLFSEPPQNMPRLDGQNLLQSFCPRESPNSQNRLVRKKNFCVESFPTAVISSQSYGY